MIIARMAFDQKTLRTTELFAIETILKWSVPLAGLLFANSLWGGGKTRIGFFIVVVYPVATPWGGVASGYFRSYSEQLQEALESEPLEPEPKLA